MPTNHGGKREGAGRKTRIAPDAPRERINVTVSREVLDRMRQIAPPDMGGNRSEMVEYFLRRGLGL